MSSKVEASAHERGHNAVNKKARKIWLSLALYLVREKTADDLKLTSLKLCACVHVHYVWPQFLLAGIQIGHYFMAAAAYFIYQVLHF